MALIDKSKVDKGYPRKAGHMPSVRRDELHRLDDVAVEDCLFRLELMETDERGDTWWLAFSRGDQSMTLRLTSVLSIEATLTQEASSRQSRGLRRR